MAVVELEIIGEVGTIRLNRPDSLNAIDEAVADALRDAMYALWQEDAVRVVVVTGNGKAFCAGGDLRRMHELGDGEGMGDVFYTVAGRFHESIAAMRQMSKPVIAAINGPAAGGGFSLALACDYRVMADDAFMKLAYTSHGLSIDGGGTFSLPRLVGLARASAIMLLDERIPAPQALEFGLVHELVPAAELVNRVAALAERFADMPVEVIGRTKRLFNQSFQTSLDEQLEAERNELAAAGDHPEGQEGVESFLGKRHPNYRR